MPVIRIEVPEGTPQDTKKRIREGVKQAVLDTLAPKETKYDYVAVREAFACLLYTSPSPRDRQKSRMPSSA